MEQLDEFVVQVMETDNELEPTIVRGYKLWRNSSSAELLKRATAFDLKKFLEYLKIAIGQDPIRIRYYVHCKQRFFGYKCICGNGKIALLSDFLEGRVR